MTSFMRRLPFILIFVLAGNIFYGCISSKTHATRFYVLNPVATDNASGGLEAENGKESLSVEIASLRLPQYLERPQIVTRSSGNQLELAEYHQWGGNLRKNMIRVIAKNLSRLLASPDIAIAPHRPSTPSDFRIDLEVMRFERNFDGRVRLSVQWRLSSGIDQKLLTTKMTDLTGEAVSEGTDMENTVSSMSVLLNELSQIIAHEMSERKTPE